MADSTNLQLPYLSGAMSQKHVAVNESLRRLDALVCLAIEDKDLTAPPGSPADGVRYIPKAAATGLWSGKEGYVAHYVDGAWEFYTPREGFLAYVADEDAFYVFDGAAWNALETGGGGGGDVVGPASATDEALVRFDGTTGKLVKNSGATLDDSGNLSASNLSGTNTGDQTIALTGDVSGTGTGSFAATIADDAVSNAKAADMGAWTVKLRNAGTSGDPTDATLGDLTAEEAPVSGDFLLGFLGTGEIRKFDIGDLPGGGGADLDTLPGFFAYKTAQSDDATGDSTEVDIVCDATERNTGGNYSTSTGLYTADRNAMHEFFATIRFNGITSSHNYAFAYLLRSDGVLFTGVFYNAYQAAAQGVTLVVACATRMYLTAGQTVKVVAQVSGGSKVVDVAGDTASRRTYFSGGLTTG